MKECFKCNRILELSEFYVHSKMADGHLNKCKECAKRDATTHRENNIAKVTAYDKERNKTEHRKQRRKVYLRDYRHRNPASDKAHQAVSKAVRSGTLVPMPCEVCKTTEGVHAHHDDYSQPLNVRWLCATHHRQYHVQLERAANTTV